jgi:hypothetical protein
VVIGRVPIGAEARAAEQANDATDVKAEGAGCRGQVLAAE